MSKAVMLSIQPKWCELIASGRKTIEVRKNCPSIETPFKCYIYMTKCKKKLIGVLHKGDDIYGTIYDEEKPLFIKGYRDTSLVGTSLYWSERKVIGEFVCDKIERIVIPSIDLDRQCKQSRLSVSEMLDYLETPNTRRYDDKPLYGWHISDLVIYDKPRELWDFARSCDGCDKKDTARCGEEASPCKATVLTRPPQSWQFVQSILGGRLHSEEV